MNYKFLKNMYENIPKKMKFALSPFFQRVIIWNPTYQNTIKKLKEYESLTDEQKEKASLSTLKSTLIYAYENTSYYKELFDRVPFNPYSMTSFKDIEKIPYLDKNIANSNGDKLYSDKNVGFYETHTSGSTGKVFKVLCDKDSIYKERAFVNYYLKKFGYNPLKTKTLALWGHNKDSDFYYSPMKNEIVISPFRLYKKDDFENVWKDIESFGPDIIAGYPSAIVTFAKLVKQFKKQLPLKLVHFYAEGYDHNIKKLTENIFRCKVVATYGHTERAAFAELYENGYKFNELYGYTELIPFINEDGEELYRIVCTGYNSKKMPLIRYVTDDAVKINCNGGFDIYGHTTSEARVIGKNGARIYKGTLSPHIQPFEKVRLYQYVQYEEGKVYLDLVLDKPFTDQDFKELKTYFERKCEGVLSIEIRIVKEIKLNNRGKYTWLISYLE